MTRVLLYRIMFGPFGGLTVNRNSVIKAFNITYVAMLLSALAGCAAIEDERAATLAASRTARALPLPEAPRIDWLSPLSGSFG